MEIRKTTSSLYQRALLTSYPLAIALGIGSYPAKAAEEMQPAAQDQIMLAYVWGFSNIGDTAIAPGLLNLLDCHFPDCKKALVASGSGTRARSYLQKDFPGCEVYKDVFAGTAYHEALSQAKEDFGGELPLLRDGNVDYVFDTFVQNLVDSIRRNNPNFTRTLTETKLVIYNSGMILVYGKGTLAGTNFWGYSVRRSLPLLVAWKLGIRYGIYAHSFDSFGDSPGRPYFKRLLEDAQFVFCRDGDSLSYVKSLGIKAPHLMFVPDSTVSFARRDDDWADTFMARHALKSREFIVVIPRTCFDTSVISRSISEKRSTAHCRKLREIIEHWVRKTGMKVVVAAEVRNQLAPARELVYDLLPEDVKSRCVMMDKYWSTKQATALYGHTRIVVTMEQHSFLLAIPEDTPTVVPIFKESGRKIWMLHDFKLGEYLFDIDTASTQEIEQGIYRIHDNYERESDRIQKDVIPHLRATEGKAMQVIAESLGIPAKPGSSIRSAPQIRLDQSSPDR